MQPICKDSFVNKLWENSRQAVKKMAISLATNFNIFSFLPEKIYCEKLKLIVDTDPPAAEEEKFTYDINCFPAVKYPDIVNYLIFGTGPFAGEDMKANKSIDAYS